MGDMVAQLAFGVVISKKDYERLFNELYEEREQRMGKSKWSLKVEKDKNSPICINNPYETDDYLLLIRETVLSAFNGTVKVEIPGFQEHWRTLIQEFIKSHHLTPESEPTWLLTGCYN